MSEDPIPYPELIPRTLPILINEKLDASGLGLKKADLDVIRELLSVYQEDRVLSPEEIEEWIESERNILENQSDYKNDSENIVRRGKCACWFCLFFTLLIVICFYKAVSPEYDFYLKLLFRWPIHFVAILIHCLHLYISTRRVPKLLQVLKDVNDDWKDSMTSAKLQSRQKALVNEWTQLVKERIKNRRLVIPKIAQFINWFYFFIRFWLITDILFNKEELPVFFFLFEQSDVLRYIEFFFTCSFPVFFFYQLGIKVKIEERNDDDMPISIIFD